MRRRRQPDSTVSMQMGPMIDVVFLLLIFFMVTAKPQKDEAEINIGLPGTVTQDEVMDIPDQQHIKIAPNGQVLLNDDAVDAPSSRELPTLLQALLRFKKSTDQTGSQAMILLDPADEVPHQRLVDVMNVCAKAGVKDVSFSGLEEEKESL